VLSACLIVKNEERFLDGCLRSISTLVDEIVVVDTGSTDRSPSIARRHGARVDHVPWRDDFAAARNHALDLAQGEWVLYIDADERVRRFSRRRLRTLLTDDAAVAHYVFLHPRPGFTPYWELRLFRRDPLIRFEGIIHETIWPGIAAYQARKGGRVGRSEVILDHEGYEGDQHAKHLRNLPLLKKALRRDPSRVFSWCHLAQVHAALGRVRLAEKAWCAGLDQVRKKRQLQADDSLPYLGLIQWRASRGRNVDELIEEGLAYFPQNLQLRWFRGQALMAAGRLEEAICLFETIVASGETGRWDHAIGYDARLFTVLSLAPLATCQFQLGRYAESRRHFERCARHDPDNVEYRVKASVCAGLEESGLASRVPRRQLASRRPDSTQWSRR
jgi:tetratricopeptide (TPR) repeat protein